MVTFFAGFAAAFLGILLGSYLSDELFVFFDLFFKVLAVLAVPFDVFTQMAFDDSV